VDHSTCQARILFSHLPDLAWGPGSTPTRSKAQHGASQVITHTIEELESDEEQDIKECNRRSPPDEATPWAAMLAPAEITSSLMITSGKFNLDSDLIIIWSTETSSQSRCRLLQISWIIARPGDMTHAPRCLCVIEAHQPHTSSGTTCRTPVKDSSQWYAPIWNFKQPLNDL